MKIVHSAECCSEKINPDIAKMLALCVVSEKAAIPKREKKFFQSTEIFELTQIGSFFFMGPLNPKISGAPLQKTLSGPSREKPTVQICSTDSKKNFQKFFFHLQQFK